MARMHAGSTRSFESQPLVRTVEMVADRDLVIDQRDVSRIPKIKETIQEENGNLCCLQQSSLT